MTIDVERLLILKRAFWMLMQQDEAQQERSRIRYFYRVTQIPHSLCQAVLLQLGKGVDVTANGKLE